MPPSLSREFTLNPGRPRPGWADGTSAHEIIAAQSAAGRVRAPAPTWSVLANPDTPRFHQRNEGSGVELHWSLSVRKRGDPRKIPHSAGENAEFRDDAVKRAEPTPVPIHTVILSEVSASLREADAQPKDPALLDLLRCSEAFSRVLGENSP